MRASRAKGRSDERNHLQPHDRAVHPLSPSPRVLRATLTWILPAWASLLLAYALPRIPLDDAAAGVALLLSNTADVRGILLLSLGFGVLLLHRSHLPARRFGRELGVHALLLVLFLGGGALFNERVTKPWLDSPRPNIVFLAEDGALGMSAETFYADLDKAERSAHLDAVLTDPGFDAIALRPDVAEHWVHQTGYSLPSGHSFSAFFFATYALAMGIAFLSGRRRWPFYALPVWAALACASRVLLFVHRPEDVLLGALEGWLLALPAVAIALALLRPAPREPEVGSA